MDGKRKLEGKARPSPGPVVKRNLCERSFLKNATKTLRIEDVGILNSEQMAYGLSFFVALCCCPFS